MQRGIWLGILFAFTSCISSRPAPRPLDLPYSFIFEGRFDDVWKSTVAVLESYTITVANRDAGLLQTDWESQRYNPDLYEHPEIPTLLEEVRSRLKIKLSKAVMNDTGAPAVRVQINKEFEVFKNFFSDWERYPTDGYEEQVLLYRINQNLKIISVKKRKSLGASSKRKN
ncbi:MAG: hypothetical protein R3A80_10245 [Bdellovibrionota bacterium]